MSYACLNKWGFSIHLKSFSTVVFLMALGNLFHSLGPDIANDLSRNVFLLLLGILSNLFPHDVVLPFLSLDIQPIVEDKVVLDHSNTYIPMLVL